MGISHPEKALCYSTLGRGMLNDGFRVRAARRRGTSKATIVCSSQDPLRPRHCQRITDDKLKKQKAVYGSTAFDDFSAIWKSLLTLFSFPSSTCRKATS